MPPKSSVNRKNTNPSSVRATQDGGTQGNKTQKKTKITEVEYECLTCKLCLNEDDNLIECEKCELWECQNCSGLTDVQYEALQTAGIHWFCQSCNEDAISAVKTAELIKTKCLQYVNELRGELLTHIDSKIDSKFAASKREMTEEIRTELKEIKESIKIQEKSIDTCTSEAAKQGVQEMSDREYRKLNMIFFNVPENLENDKEKQQEEDTKYLEEIKQALQIDTPFSKLGWDKKKIQQIDLSE
ncbi:hypothetical protein SNE40_018344 [Patella caerulea]|uniref:PHD-type domain-containing protein n=1 Tax=Patella caerulea TaxID=87958 RepID=A0AAN8JAA3_PATCE